MKLYFNLEKVNSLVIALYISESSVCMVINAIVPIPYISFFLTLVLVFHVLILNRYKIVFSSKSFAFFLIALLLLFFSMIKNGIGVSKNYFQYLLLFGGTAVIFSDLQTSYKEIVVGVIKIHIVVLSVYFLVMRNTFLNSSDYWHSQMGIAYGMILPILFPIAFLIYYKYFFRDYSLLLIPISILEIGMASFVVLFDCGTRGAIVSIIIGVILILISKVPKSRMPLTFFVCTAMILFLLLNMNGISTWISTQFYYSDIRSLRKFARMIVNGISDNGRTDYYHDAYIYFLAHPIFGNGVGYFERLHHGTYTHQIIYQVLCEFGIIGFTVLIQGLIKIIRIITITDRTEKKLFVVLLISMLSVLLYSSTYWLLPVYWFTTFMIINYERK